MDTAVHADSREGNNKADFALQQVFCNQAGSAGM